jgi:cobalt-zinc-cadmium efflux system outer membrane protein
MALANNPAVAQAAARVQALRGSWVQAGLPPNPMVGYMADEIGDAGTAGMQGGYVSQQFITGGKLGLSRSVVAQEMAVAGQQLAARRQRVLTDVRTGYYDVLIAQRKRELADELVSISQLAVEASEQLLAAREIPRIGLLQTEVEASNALILLQRAENEYAAAWRNLTSVVGTPELQPARVTGQIDDATIELDFEDQLARVIAQSPEAAAAAAQVAQARWALDRARAQVVPDVFTQVSVQYNNASGDTVTGIQAGLPIPLWNKNQGGILQARQEVIAAVRNAGRVELDLRQRMTAAFQQYADARVQAETYSADILPRAKETLSLVTTGYRAGEIGYLDLLTAQRTYFQTAMAYVEALRELWRARLLIEGLLLEGSLEPDGAS